MSVNKLPEPHPHVKQTIVQNPKGWNWSCFISQHPPSFISCHTFPQHTIAIQDYVHIPETIMLFLTSEPLQCYPLWLVAFSSQICPILELLMPFKTQLKYCLLQKAFPVWYACPSQSAPFSIKSQLRNHSPRSMSSMCSHNVMHFPLPHIYDFKSFT